MCSLHGGVWQSELARRFLGGAGWSLAGSILTQVVTMVTILILVRILGKETYGKFVLAQTTVNMFGILVGFGIGATATRYAAALKRTNPERLGCILALNERLVVYSGFFATCVLFFFAPVLSNHVLGTPDLSSVLALASGAVFFSTLDGYQKSILIGFEDLRAFAAVSILGAVAGAPVLLYSVTHFGLQGAALGLALMSMVQAGVSRIQLRRTLREANIRLRHQGSWKEWRIIRDFSFPALLSGALVVPAHWACQVMLATTPDGYAQIALLGIAMQWFNVTMFLPAIAGRVVLPMLTEAVMTGNHADARRILRLATLANLAMALPIAIGVAVLSRWIIALYGQEFESGVFVISVAVFSATTAAVVSGVGHMLAARSRMWLGMLMNVGWAAVYVGISMALLSHGAAGVVLGLLTAYILHALWTARWAYRQVDGLATVSG